MKRLVLAALLVSTAAAEPSGPGGPKVGPLLAGQIAETQVEVKGRMVTEIHMGQLRIVLEETRLGEAQALFGGQKRASGEAGSAKDWLCYRTGPTRSGPPMMIWLVSDSEMSGGSEAITDVALELDAGAPNEDCALLRGDLGIDFGLPTLGVDLKTLTGAFGEATPDKDGLVTYAYTAREPPDSDVGQLLTYRFESGYAVAVVVEQETTH